MYDTIERVGHSLIQHGKNNDRIYLMKLDKRDKDTIIPKLENLAIHNKYSKIFAKIPVWASFQFQKNNFFKEAFIPNMYNGQVGSYFMSKYFDRSRYIISKAKRDEIYEKLQLAKSKSNKVKDLNMEIDFNIRILTQEDVPQLAELFKIVFKSYPFPIFDESYLLKTMKKNIVYFGAFKEDKLVAASSAEMDMENWNVEMTDFATHPDFLGNNLSLHLLINMESEMKDKNIITAYSLALSLSTGINITFSKNNYQFSGLLINNTNINGQIESMNVWYKKL